MIRWLFLFITLLVLLMAGCTTVTYDNPMTEVPQTIAAPTESEYPHSLYFPDDGSYSFVQEIAAGETVLVDEIITTNTTCITVRNTGSISVVCNIYSPDDPEDMIMTNEIASGKKIKFNNLSSAFSYQIGFEALQSGTIEIEISG